MNKTFENISPNENKPEKKTNRRGFLKFLGAGATLAAIGGMAELFQEEEIEKASKKATKINIGKLEVIEEDVKLEPEGKKEKIANTPKEIAELVKKKHAEVSKKEEIFPKEIFTDNFFIATQLQESNFKTDAESHAGAAGVMQVMPITVKEVVRFLHKLDNKGDVENFYCREDDKLKTKDIKEIIKLIKNDADYGRAFGKLYFADLYNLHKIGEKEIKKRDIRGAQKKLLACYNWVPSRFKKVSDNEKKWPKETQDYYKRIFRNMDYLEKFQEKITKTRIKSNPNYLSMKLVQVMNSYKKINERSPIFDKLLDRYVSEIKNAEDARLGRKLKDDEIKKIMALLKNKFMGDYLAYLKNPDLITKT